LEEEVALSTQRTVTQRTEGVVEETHRVLERQEQARLDKAITLATQRRVVMAVAVVEV
jgi:hypothetical protein